MFRFIKNYLSLLLVFSVWPIFAQKTDTIKVWSNDAHKNEAELYVYHPKHTNKTTAAILICPGGGYRGLAIDREGYNMAKWYASNGILGVVLKYRMPKGHHEVPLSDAAKAMSIIRENAEKWHIDINRIGIIGSSAGGHLAASVCTLLPAQERPNFAILYYPVISFDDKIAHKGSKQNLLGEKVTDSQLVERYTLNKQVDRNTPRTLLLLSADDKVVPPMNSILYYESLNQHGIPASMYMFPLGGHGWGIKYDFAYYQEVKDLIMKWLIHNQIIRK